MPQQQQGEDIDDSDDCSSDDEAVHHRRRRRKQPPLKKARTSDGRDAAVDCLLDRPRRGAGRGAASAACTAAAAAGRAQGRTQQQKVLDKVARRQECLLYRLGGDRQVVHDEAHHPALPRPLRQNVQQQSRRRRADGYRGGERRRPNNPSRGERRRTRATRTSSASIFRVLEPLPPDAPQGYMRERLWGNTLDHLIVDEVSMIPGEFWDRLDWAVRNVRSYGAMAHVRGDRTGSDFDHVSELPPFGGIQLIVCGDLLQLPPVEAGYGAAVAKNMAFDADAPARVTRTIAAQKG